MNGLGLSEEIVDIAAGVGFTLLLTKGGKLLSCGENDYGQLGIGSQAARYIRAPKEIR